ncbi:MAG TPA: glycosyltransferase, partial [Chlamydiales bacterium]|nr:glycosyltransferase [Chlamydiales bacterium]
MAALIGFGLGSGYLTKKEGAKLAKGIHPEKEFPITEYKSFAIVLFAHNDAPWCERALRSIFAQDYDYFRVLFIDDGSRDDTYEKVKDFVVANQQEHRVILMRNETEMGVISSLYRIAGHCLDREVVVPLLLSDWLAGPGVLSSLNRAFQNPDVWITCGKTLHYPSYEFLDLPEWNGKKIEKQGYSDYEGLRAFYAALLKQLPLQNTASKNFSLVPLLELAGGRVKNILEPLSFRNRVSPNSVHSHAAFAHHYAPLVAFPKNEIRSPEADVIVFSNDRPLQLFAVLESLQRYATGVRRISVVYRASDKYASAYSQMKETFPDISFALEGERLNKSLAEYVLLAKDELVLKEAVDLKACIEAMEKTHADHFFLGAIEAPSSKMTLSDQMIAFTPEKASTMALLRKESIQECKRMK